jgi:deoxyribonuclease (pyrimidine dimer)
MTRINVFPPSLLADQHLIAEYRELPRIFQLARILKDEELVPTYRLGTGHVKFFYPFTGWLSRRQSAIIHECRRRGFNIQHDCPPRPVAGLDADWAPTNDARRINAERLVARLQAKPGFYRFWSKKVDGNFYNSLVFPVDSYC